MWARYPGAGLVWCGGVGWGVGWCGVVSGRHLGMLPSMRIASNCGGPRDLRLLLLLLENTSKALGNPGRERGRGGVCEVKS